MYEVFWGGWLCGTVFLLFFPIICLYNMPLRSYNRRRTFKRLGDFILCFTKYMDLSYNLRYQKFSFSNRVMVDKEGEIIVYAKGFRLKGKGATDKGELISFSDLKEFYFKDEQIIFITFNKEKYILSEAYGMFEQLLKDLYKARNEFLTDALFMKVGRIKAEFEGSFERISKFSKLISKGKAKIKIYERSLVVVPVHQDAFSVNFSFVNFYEFEDDDYNVKIVLDDGQILNISKLGDDFELFQEKLDEILGGLYQSIVSDVLRECFGYFDLSTLLKLAYKLKGGKSVSKKDIMKIDKELYEAVHDFIFDNEDFKQKFEGIIAQADDSNIRFGIAKDFAQANGFIRWVLIALPEKNTVLFSILPRWESALKDSENSKRKDETIFYKIIMEKGNPFEKTEDKISEIEQALLGLNFAKDPCYKDKRDLKYSPFQYAIRKMPFLRILRKSFAGIVASEDIKEWQEQAKKLLNESVV